MNPRDIMTDAIHNFHPQYQQYTQYSSGIFKQQNLSNIVTHKPLEWSIQSLSDEYRIKISYNNQMTY